MRLGFTLLPGMRVGLFGGSFNPAHSGHAHLAETARVRLRLDRVLWLVSPGNPLKGSRGAANLPQRLASARALARGPSMIVTDAERRLGVRYTVDAVRKLQARHPGVRFVWLMGADNLAGFQAWRGWTDLLRETPVAVVSRPGRELLARSAPAAQRFDHARRPSREAALLAGMTPPAWLYLEAPLNYQSSTKLRAQSGG